MARPSNRRERIHIRDGDDGDKFVIKFGRVEVEAIKEGDGIILENDPTYMKDLPRPQKAKVHLTKRITRTDCVLLFHGIGHRAKNLKVAANFGYRDGDLIPQKDPAMLKKFDPTGMGWVEDVFVSIKKM